ncbi:MAG: 5-dehydro-4-deoxy-D-glucuronate isomerase [Opitutia bacterium]|nr:5-dehydro-4-deoxy-D-glucuronate isomerase [Opitutaceae bacterium]PHX87059.1 MAG: 5-dehydro-4-deoxy-D-glucuronate isomerase [Opitutae bacterium]
MKLHYFPTPAATNTLSTEQLRETFLIGGLFRLGEVIAHYADLDRMICGAAVPTGAPLGLPTDKELGTSFFLERREIGVLNVGSGAGVVRVGGIAHTLSTLDCLYIGLGEKDVVFENSPAGQAQFYFVSTPAHAKHPTVLVRRAEVSAAPIGDATKANRRTILKYIHPGGIKSCQLVLGFTEFEPGSIWNTMPPHTHSRRTEIYLYFDLGENIAMHFMGEPQATRHLVVRDREAVLSPAWSIHCGVGTGAYRFVWAMGGDNQVFADMDPAPIATLK